MPLQLSSSVLSSLRGPQRHQARLVHAVLLLMTLYFAVLGTLNILVFDNMNIALMDYAGLTGIVGVLWYFRRTGDLKATSWIVVSLITAILLLFIHLVEGRSYSIMWVTVLPPISFFLLGRRAGAWICGVVFTYVCIYFYLRMSHQPPLSVSLGSLLNIIEVMIAHWFLFRLYERSRAEAYAELERLSETDKLTGLYNRSRLDSLLMQEFNKHQHQGLPLTLIIADIDHFKRINDEHGHLVGDAILREIGTQLRIVMRNTDFCGRWGGEEFLFICANTSETDAIAIVTKLQATLTQTTLTRNIRVTMSFGVATLAHDTSAEQQLRRADDALYEAKRRGRNSYVVATQLISNWATQAIITPNTV